MISIVRFDPPAHPKVTYALIDMAEAEFPEFRVAGLDKEHMMDVLSRPTTACIAAVDEEVQEYGGVVGMLVVCATAPWYNPNYLMWSDLFAWVHPAVRERGVFARMVGVLEDAARRAGVKRLSLAQSSGFNVQDTADKYGKMGYRVTGFMAVKEL